MLRYSLATLRSFPENDKIDIYIIAGRRFFKAVSLFAPDSIKLVQWEVDTTQCPPNDAFCIGILSSMRKTKIFEIIPEMTKYEAVLFLDADIAITGPLEPLFLKVIEDGAHLHTKPDEYAPGNLTEAHSMHFFGNEDYTPEEMAQLVNSNTPVFNAGQFAFVPSKTMQDHFTALNDVILNHGGKRQFYEQSHMNRYFNIRNLTLSTLDAFVKFNDYVIPEASTGKSAPLLIHVPNNYLSWVDKLNKMKAAWKTFLESPKNVPIEHPTRYLMHEVIDASTINNIIEIGVFQGNFSKYLLTNFKPSKLYLIDPWKDEDVGSGNADGDDLKTYFGGELYQNVTRNFANNTEVVVLRKFSDIVDDIYMFDDQSMDLIYVDGDHSYEGVLKDLKAAIRLLKPGKGWMAGHDFQCKFEYDAVKQAVIDFCVDYGFKIHHMFLDGCSSWAIHV